MCNEKGRLSPALTVKIEGQLDGRKYLEANELDLLISLLKIYSSACAEQVLEQHCRKEILGLLSQGLCLNKKKKSCHWRRSDFVASWLLSPSEVLKFQMY